MWLTTKHALSLQPLQEGGKPFLMISPVNGSHLQYFPTYNCPAGLVFSNTSTSSVCLLPLSTALHNIYFFFANADAVYLPSHLLMLPQTHFLPVLKSEYVISSPAPFDYHIENLVV